MSSNQWPGQQGQMGPQQPYYGAQQQQPPQYGPLRPQYGPYGPPQGGGGGNRGVIIVLSVILVVGAVALGAFMLFNRPSGNSAQQGQPQAQGQQPQAPQGQGQEQQPQGEGQQQGQSGGEAPPLPEQVGDYRRLKFEESNESSVIYVPVGQSSSSKDGKDSVSVGYRASTNMDEVKAGLEQRGLTNAQMIGDWYCGAADNGQGGQGTVCATPAHGGVVALIVQAGFDPPKLAEFGNNLMAAWK